MAVAATTKPAGKARAAKANVMNAAPAGFLDCCRGLIEGGHVQPAREQLEAYLRKAPLSAEAIVMLAQVAAASGDAEGARARLLEADMARPGFLPGRLLQAELLASEDDLEGALAVLFQTAEWHPTEASVLQEIAALTRDRSDYLRLRRQWLSARLNGLSAPGGARAVAKAAALVDDFQAATDIYRWLISKQLGRIAADKAKNVVRPPKVSAGRLGEGKGTQALADLKTLLDKAKIPFFLISGTLLGYLRDGRMLPGDKDIDVGVFQQDYDHARLVKAFRRSPLFTVKRLDNLDRLRIAHVNGVWIDVFPHYREGDLIWHDGTASRWSNTPFEIGEMKVGAATYAVPQPPERYLDENYGDWRTPNAMFDVRYEAPNAQVRSPEYLNLLVYIRVFEGLTSYRWDVVAKYAADFPALFQTDAVLDRARAEGETITAFLAAQEQALRQGLTPPRFPEAATARRAQSDASTTASTSTAAPGAEANSLPAPPARKNPNHVRVAKWFIKRWRRVFGAPTRS